VGWLGPKTICLNPAAANYVLCIRSKGPPPFPPTVLPPNCVAKAVRQKFVLEKLKSSSLITVHKVY
jgi:hypothetical protein